MSREPESSGGAEIEPTETVKPPDVGGTSPPPPAGGGDLLSAAETVGRYSVLSHLGSGGMGSVYAAYDPDLDRKVALKLVRQDRSSPEEQRRLLQEARALAQLSHPNVVRVYDVGWHGGQVFFAMEFVSGRNLWHWLQGGKRSWPRTLELFTGVARGLAAAHDRGLVHRDLKPENILVGEDGQALIADFGLVEPVARGAGTGLGSGGPTPGSEGPGDRGAGTPAYRAPELAEGVAATPLSDQYSFSVAFFVALYGERPGKVWREASRPAEPPRKWNELRAAHGVPLWLHRVLVRGLSPRPEDRYPSMAALLKGLRQPGRRRRRLTTAALALGLAAAGSALWWPLGAPGTPPCSGGEDRFAEVWNPARRRAVEEAFLATGSSFAAEAAARTASILDRYATGWVDSHREACLATRVRGEQSERVLDLRMLCLERRRQEARALTRLLTDPDTDMVAEAVRAADSLSSPRSCDAGAELALVSPLPEDPEKRRTIAALQARVAREAVRRSAGQKPDRETLEEVLGEIDGVGYAPLAAEARLELGRMLLSQFEDIGGAVAAMEGALEAAIAGGDRPLRAVLYSQLAEATGYYQGDMERGERWARYAEAALAALGPGHEEARFVVRSRLAVVAWSAGRAAEAQSFLEEALEVGLELWGPASSRLSEVYNNLSLVTSSHSEQIFYLGRALEIKERAYGRWHPRVANTLVNLGGQSGRVGDYREGLAHASRAREIIERAYSPQHPTLAYPLTLEGELYNRLDSPDRATAALERALAVSQELEESYPVRIQALFDLAESSLLQLDLSRAQDYFDQAEALARSFPPDSPFRVFASGTQGRILLAKGRYGPAKEALEAALAKAEAAAVPLPLWQTLGLHLGLGEAELGLGRTAAAREVLERALRLAEGTANEPVLRAGTRFALGRSLWQEDPPRARDLVLRAAKDLPPSGSPATRRLRERIAAWQQGGNGAVAGSGPG